MMKKHLLIILLFLQMFAFSQTNYIDILYLKNGSIIRGTITELSVNSQVKIKTTDGSLFVYKWEDVEKIEKEEAPKTSPQEKNIGGISYKKSGFFAMPFIGGIFSNKSMVGATGVVIGYQFSPKYVLGAGAELNLFGDRGMVPLYVSNRIYFSEGKKNAFSVHLNTGYCAGYIATSVKANAVADVGIGFRSYLTKNIAFQTEAFYRFLTVTDFSLLHDFTLHGAGIRLGVSF